ncbi:MAG: hypothetical protein C4520_18895 [Candidatus Abyssobacteria bacterium SURF_5]|uniref:Uncharacterized protein n=1 Tax=Abyssobacteria bacterium (strain SURF_5) TaxID=2093360 RepID=A0A3A4NKV1_ABYX5|nr:MAG: hypothetical protein C4520_18895 [Candidatus Abyssubacteria bacterium SURF_5]
MGGKSVFHPYPLPDTRLDLPSRHQAPMEDFLFPKLVLDFSGRNVVEWPRNVGLCVGGWIES